MYIYTYMLTTASSSTKLIEKSGGAERNNIKISVSIVMCVFLCV